MFYSLTFVDIDVIAPILPFTNSTEGNNLLEILLDL